VQDLHRTFVDWFLGRVPKATLKADLNKRLQTDFSHVAPNGRFLRGRNNLIAHLDDKYGCYKGRLFTIDIYSVQLMWYDTNKCLCMYEEWQSWEQDGEDARSQDGASPAAAAARINQFGRLSSCLLERDAAGNFSWIHVHETWLEEEAPMSPQGLMRRASWDDEGAGAVVAVGDTQQQDAATNGSSSSDPVSVLLLLSNQTLSKEQMASQELALSIFEEQDIPYTTLDGTDPAQREERNNLFKTSRVWGKYPQFFLAPAQGKPTYWGDHIKFAKSIEAGTLAQDLGLSNPEEDRNGVDLEQDVGDVDVVDVDEDDGDEKDDDKQTVGVSTAAIVGGAAVVGAAGAGTAVALHKVDGNSSKVSFAEPEHEANSAPEWAAPPAAKDDGLEIEPDNSERSGTSEQMTPEEEEFMNASAGILVFEEEDECGKEEEESSEEEEDDMVTPKKPPVENIASPIPQDISKKRHISPKLDKYAKPLTWENTLVGISVAGFDIGSSQGPIGDEAWYREMSTALEDVAQSRANPNPRRKLVLPEMVFPTAHIALEGHGVWLSWDVTDALEEWAKSHQEIALFSDSANNGVQVLKAKDAKLWEKKQEKLLGDAKSAKFHYDWSYSTPFCGKLEGGHWDEIDASGMRLELLTDQSVPILFFDEVVLFEDDLHDNGQAEFSVKLRVMPSCAFVLARYWLRVDDVVVRLRETRILVDFFGMKPRIYRDVTWRECWWDDLAANGLPTDVKSWSNEQGRETPEWSMRLKSIPEIDLPEHICKYAVMENGDANGGIGDALMEV
jgi:type 2A phosphatase activator TIP41